MKATFRLDIAAGALDEIAGAEGLDFADARVVEDERDLLALRNHTVDSMERMRSAGIGVRALVHGAWGFAAEPDPSPESAARAARRAVEIARGVAAAGGPRVRLAEEEPQRGTYETPVAIDPFDVAPERRVEDLTAALDALRGSSAHAAIRSIHASMRWDRRHVALATSEGSRIEQRLTFGGAGIGLAASDGDVAVQRSHPMDYDGGLAAAGYEVIDRADYVGQAERIREEALALLSAPDCPAGTTSLVLDTPQLALQIHESCGHPTESDRALGDEVSLAGASFLTPDRLGRFQYGAPIVNLTADSRTPRGLGTFGWDDEGVPARRTPLVSRGVFVGYLSSRETAETLGLGRSAGCMRADSWSRPPIIRMINVSLEPDPDGPASLDELVADTDDGILMTTNRSWSIDDLRLNFQFGCEVGWEIKRGKIARMVRFPLYTASTPRFWASCDAIGNQQAWKIWGLASCGKGDPMQMMAVGHGCAPARFRNIEIGCSR